MQPLQYDLRSPAAKDKYYACSQKRKQHLQSHLHCGKDPTVAKRNGIPSATHPPATLAIPFTLREGSYSCKSQWNSIGNSSTSTTCNPIYTAGTILQLQITMEFCRPHMHEKQLNHHLQCGTDPTMIRDRSDHDPTMIRPHTRPSRTRRTAEVDHRGSGTHFVWKNISQKRISCFLQNSIGNSSSSTTCNPIYTAGTILQLQITMEFCRPHMHEKQLNHHLQCGTDPRPIRPWSDHDPTMIRPWSDHDPTTRETVSHPSHRRGRSSWFGDALCLEKHRVSCICYLSKTHFVLPSKLHPQLIHQHRLQSHLHCFDELCPSLTLALANSFPQ